MKILFFTKSKPYTLKTLQELIKQGHEVTVVCKSYDTFENSEMESFCITNKVQYIQNDDLYLEKNKANLMRYDLGISNTYGRLIKKEVIDALCGRIFNVHTAPLPDYKGMFAYNWALYNEEKEWGVTVHYVNEKFDEGNIIKVQKFPIDVQRITVSELELESQRVGYELTVNIVKEFLNESQPIGYPQEGEGKYYSRADFERLKLVDENDSIEEKKKKFHACWCPPYDGAYYIKDGEKIYLNPDDFK